VRVTDEIAMSAETIPSLQQGTSCSAATKSGRDRQRDRVAIVGDVEIEGALNSISQLA
jgi:hypothetical protein